MSCRAALEFQTAPMTMLTDGIIGGSKVAFHKLLGTKTHLKSDPIRLRIQNREVCWHRTNLCLVPHVNTHTQQTSHHKQKN